LKIGDANTNTKKNKIGKCICKSFLKIFIIYIYTFDEIYNIFASRVTEDLMSTKTKPLAKAIVVTGFHRSDTVPVNHQRH